MTDLEPPNGQGDMPPEGDDPFHTIVVLLYRALHEYLGRRPSTGAQSTSTVLPIPLKPDLPRVLKNVGEIIHELLQTKKDDGLSMRYIQTLRSHLLRFAASFNKEITSITTSEIEKWLRGQEFGPRARNNMRGSVLTLFLFARSKEHLPKATPPQASELP